MFTIFKKLALNFMTVTTFCVSKNSMFFFNTHNTGGVGNIRTGNTRATFEIFGQCWKYSDDFFSVNFSLEVFGQTFFAEKYSNRLYFKHFLLLTSFRNHFAAYISTFCPSFRLRKPYFRIDLDAKSK